jgi:glycerol-3-phosphate acyltransferase PlsY
MKAGRPCKGRPVFTAGMISMEILQLLIGIVAAYLIGSFPTGVIVGRLFFKKDPRDGGSGASGATNMFRQFGAAAGIAVSLVDVAKGSLAVIVCAALGLAAFPDGLLPLKMAGSLASVLGHVYPIWAGFRGGKGVATGGGAILAIAPGATLWAALGFLLVLGSTGIVSASSITAALVLPVAVALGAAGRPASPWMLGFAVLLAVFVVFTHRANIGRILKREEKSFDKVKFLRFRKK